MNSADHHKGALENVRICLVFEGSLTHYTRILQEIRVLQGQGALITWLTSDPGAECPEGTEKIYAPLVTWGNALSALPHSNAGWMPARHADEFLRRMIRWAASRGTPKATPRLRRSALRRIAPRIDLFWVIDFPGLPTVMEVARRRGKRVVYETVDLVPEYPYEGESHRTASLATERQLIGHVDGFITACDSYAEYYLERYGDVLPRPPVVRDNMPEEIAVSIRDASEPVSLLFMGSLMSDRPVEELIRAMALSTTGATLTFQGKNLLGDAPTKLIEELGLQHRIRVLDPCPPESTVETAALYDVGVVALAGSDENERRASTSKLFTYMSAGLAILGSDLPGIRRVIDEYQNGMLVYGMEPAGWASAIDELASMPLGQVNELKQRSLDAARLHVWETQRPAFIGEFVRALGNGGVALPVKTP